MSEKTQVLFGLVIEGEFERILLTFNSGILSRVSRRYPFMEGLIWRMEQ
jgi:hypothetical protein